MRRGRLFCALLCSQGVTVEAGEIIRSQRNGSSSSFWQPPSREAIQSSRRQDHIPKFAYRLNKSTKWVAAATNLVAVLSNPSDLMRPFIVIGAIFGSVLTETLKGVWNQSRPSGALLVDPGMPSSHAFLAFFLALAWDQHVAFSVRGRCCLFGSALLIAGLRVICGYHTSFQILVGALLGTILGFVWYRVGKNLLSLTVSRPPLVRSGVLWALYIALLAAHVRKHIERWYVEDKL